MVRLTFCDGSFMFILYIYIIVHIYIYNHIYGGFHSYGGTPKAGVCFFQGKSMAGSDTDLRREGHSGGLLSAGGIQVPKGLVNGDLTIKHGDFNQDTWEIMGIYMNL